MNTPPTNHKYTVTVVATHKIRETYVVFSDKSIEDLKEDIKNDPLQLYSGDAIDMIDEDFIETELEFDGITTDNEFDAQSRQHDNRIELVELTQVDEDDIELGDEDERPFPDSDEAIRALQDVEEAVEEMEAEIAELRAENKRLRVLLEMKEETQ